MNERWLIRIHAQWFPVAPMFLVSVGLCDAPVEASEWLTPIGFRPMPDWAKATTAAYWLRMAGMRESLVLPYSAYFTDVAQVIVRNAVNDMMYEPRLIEGCVRDEAIGSDPRKGERARCGGGTMSCGCPLCRDDREAAVSWQARAAEARAKAAELIKEAEGLEQQAERTIERISSYPARAYDRSEGVRWNG